MDIYFFLWVVLWMVIAFCGIALVFVIYDTSKEDVFNKIK